MLNLSLLKVMEPIGFLQHMPPKFYGPSTNNPRLQNPQNPSRSDLSPHTRTCQSRSFVCPHSSQYGVTINAQPAPISILDRRSHFCLIQNCTILTSVETQVHEQIQSARPCSSPGHTKSFIFYASNIRHWGQIRMHNKIITT